MKLLFTFHLAFAFNLHCIGSEISYEYNEHGQLIQINDPRGLTTQYAYDALQGLEK